MTKMLSALIAVVLVASPIFAAPPPNSFNARLKSLDEPRRRAVLRRAILDSNERCTQVTATAFGGPYKNLLRWTASCKVGGDYLIFIGPDGSAQVRRCEQTARLGLPSCAIPPRKK